MFTCALAQPCQLACAARASKHVEVRDPDAGLESCEIHQVHRVINAHLPADEPELYVDDISAADALAEAAPATSALMAVPVGDAGSD